MEWLRRTYYRAVLGSEEGEKRYLLDKEEADLRLAQAHLVARREKAVRLITRKNRLQGQLQMLAADPEQEELMKACEAEYLAAAAEVEQMKEDVGREEEAVRAQTAAYHEKCDVQKKP